MDKFPLYNLYPLIFYIYLILSINFIQKNFIIEKNFKQKMYVIDNITMKHYVIDHIAMKIAFDKVCC